MGKFSDEIAPAHKTFIEHQKLFFIATAPLSEEGHINLSPKGMDTFRVLSPTSVAYLDFNGSGNETSAHLLENGRVTFMFCAFDGPPNILRLYGNGQTILPTDERWESLISLFDIGLDARQIILAAIHKVQTSCGYSVPFYSYEGERDHAFKWVAAKGEEGLKQYRQEKNRTSIDGLPTALGSTTG